MMIFLWDGYQLFISVMFFGAMGKTEMCENMDQ